MNAFDAKKASKKFKDNNYNYQRVLILNLIDRQIRNHGYTYYVIDEDDLRIRMDESDWNYFENLGYEVIRPKNTKYNKDGIEMYSLTFGIIKW